MNTAQENKATQRSRRDMRVGVVDSISGSKTIRVLMDRLDKHPLYGKYMRRRTKLLVHDEQTQAKVGDMVEVAHCRPLSKSKSWRLVRVIRRAPGA